VYASVPLVVLPCIATGSVPSRMCVVVGDRFHTIQWSHMPSARIFFGTSGSSIISTSDRAFFCTSEISKGGLLFSASHVYWDGIFPLFLNAVLVSFIMNHDQYEVKEL